MPRIVSPPKDQLHKLRQKLTPGEQLVFEFFDELLPVEWEIYIQPHLNRLRPDFVLLNPNVGIGVFEVKDWNLDAMEYFVDDRPGQALVLKGHKDGETFSREAENPIPKIDLYKREINELYCPRLDAKAGLATITAGVIFPFADDDEIRKLFAASRARYNMLDYERYYPPAGAKALREKNMQAIFPAAERQSSYYMRSDLADDLRNWLVEPDVAASQRRPLELDANQKKLVTSRTETGYRRIRGPAGAGKSLVLAARAAELSREGKEVLIVTFNITLLNYLRDLAVRWPEPGAAISSSITLLNFHRWCIRVCIETGHNKEYTQLWKQPANDKHQNPEDHRRAVLEHGMAELVKDILDGPDAAYAAKYDAVLVDEGQDFLPEWWSALRKVCKEGGEMLLVADATQDTYGTASKWPGGAWTDNPMTGAGFRGPWVNLDISYRLPHVLKKYVREFAEDYMPRRLGGIPDSEQLQLDLYPAQLRWVQTKTEQSIEVCLREVLRLVKTAEPNVSFADIMFLVSRRAIGQTLVDELARKGIKTVHTFDEDDKVSRKQKLSFYKGRASVKGTTIYSFKGWESRALVMLVDQSTSDKDRALIYTGLTRLKRHPDGSYLTVVSTVPELEAFGRKWPEFEAISSDMAK